MFCSSIKEIDQKVKECQILTLKKLLGKPDVLKTSIF